MADVTAERLPWVRAAGTIVAGVLAVALAAQVRIPVPGTPIPMTLQALAVLVAGLLLPPRSALVSMIAYLACGTAGLPVFAPHSTGLLGPTGGYLVGFIVGAGLVSWVKGHLGVGWARSMAACLLGMAAIFGLGVSWLALLPFNSTSLKEAAISPVAAGLLPFSAKAVVECALAATIAECRARWRSLRLDRQRRQATAGSRPDEGHLEEKGSVQHGV
jgi:biotin transport system substrate-specific component